MSSAPSKPVSSWKTPAPPQRNNAYQNNPESSQVMPFNNGVIKQINKSPTLQNQLNQLIDKGWAIQPGQTGGGSYADEQNKLIIMDPEHLADDNEAVQTLAHEAGHALYPVDIDHSSRENYINSLLSDEGGATLNNIKVQREILANGGEDIGIAGSTENLKAYNEAYDKMMGGEISRNSAAQSIGKIFGEGEIASGTDMNYHDYYGSFYDQ